MSLLLRVALILAPFVLPACSIHLGDHGWHGNWRSVRGSGVLTTVSHEVPAFSRVEVSGAMNLIVESGPPTPVEVTGDDNILPHLQIEVIGDTLIVAPRHSISPKTEIVVRASTPMLQGIDASGATDVTVHNLDSPRLDLNVSGASDVTVDGRCEHVEAEVSGAADLDLRALVVRTAEVGVSGAADVDVHAEEDLHARVSGAASVRNHGSGETRGHVSGAGSLERCGG